MPAYFVSDVHLHPSRPETVDAFLGVMQSLVQELKVGELNQLFLLGDIFDAWVGDDDPSPLWQRIKQALKALVKAGFSVYWVAGNRDFLVGTKFMAETGCKALAEPSVVSLEAGHRVVVLHGDLLCTKDRAYQWFRRFVRHPWILWCYQKLPLTFRLGIAKGLRALSRPEQTPRTIPLSYEPALKKEEGEEDIDSRPNIAWINEAMSDDLLKKYQAQTLVHGHVHRLGLYDRMLNEANGTMRPAKRIVLGDWDAGPCVLVFKEGVFCFKKF